VRRGGTVPADDADLDDFFSTDDDEELGAPPAPRGTKRRADDDDRVTLLAKIVRLEEEAKQLREEKKRQYHTITKQGTQLRDQDALVIDVANAPYRLWCEARCGVCMDPDTFCDQQCARCQSSLCGTCVTEMTSIPLANPVTEALRLAADGPMPTGFAKRAKCPMCNLESIHGDVPVFIRRRLPGCGDNDRESIGKYVACGACKRWNHLEPDLYEVGKPSDSRSRRVRATERAMDALMKHKSNGECVAAPYVFCDTSGVVDKFGLVKKCIKAEHTGCQFFKRLVIQASRSIDRADRLENSSIALHNDLDRASELNERYHTLYRAADDPHPTADDGEILVAAPTHRLGETVRVTPPLPE